MKTNITILYVEDESQIQDNTKRPLSYMCDTLLLASNGEEGLKLYKQHSPDIVISDIKMPIMNGIDMCKEIKQINKHQHILFTTAHSESSYFMEAIEMQVDGYILKPIDYDLLENKIEDIIEQIELKLANKEQEDKIHQQELTLLEQSKNAQMGEMLANIAHQWRQPLSIISTAATGMLMQKEYGMLDDEKLEKQCNRINNTAQFLSQTIDVFMNYIKEKKELKEVILQERIHITIDIIKSMLDMHKIKLINNIDEVEPIRLPLVIGELSQVLINIINNAKDILIQKDISDKHIKLDLHKTNTDAIITVQDNAGGIPQEIIYKIFDPYFTTKHKSQGTGLGLYMSKNMIEKSLNGTLSVANGDEGAIFTITIPLVNKVEI